MQSLKLFTLLIVGAALLSASGCGAELPDRLVLRDGNEIACQVEEYGAGTFVIDDGRASPSYPRSLVGTVRLEVNREVTVSEPETPATSDDKIFLRDGKVVTATLEAIDTETVRTSGGNFSRDKVYRIDLGTSRVIALPTIPGVKKPSMCWSGWISYDGNGSWIAGGGCNPSDVYVHGKLTTRVEGLFSEQPPVIDCLRGPCMLEPLDARYEVTYEHKTQPACSGVPYGPRWSFSQSGDLLEDLRAAGLPNVASQHAFVLSQTEGGGLASYTSGALYLGPLLARTLALGWYKPHEISPVEPFANAIVTIGQGDKDSGAPRQLNDGGSRMFGKFDWEEASAGANHRVKAEWDLNRHVCPDPK